MCLLFCFVILWMLCCVMCEKRKYDDNKKKSKKKKWHLTQKNEKEKALPPLVDFAILGTTKSPKFCDLRERDGLSQNRRLVRYAGAKPFRAL